jgi:hypothetical protein
MPRIGCLSLFIVAAIITGIAAFVSTSQGALIAAIVMIATIIIGLAVEKINQKRRFDGYRALAIELRALERGISPISNTWLNIAPGEHVFAQLEGVNLGEYVSSGSDFVSGYVGANYKLTKNLSISGGGIRGGSATRQEQLTAVDNGRVAFSNQRVVFIGGKHSREWKLGDVLGLDIAESGVWVKIHSRGQKKVSVLSRNKVWGLTPGIALSIAETVYQEGEAAAQTYSAGIAKDIEDQFGALGKPSV